jgi:hypothetical protein
MMSAQLSVLMPAASGWIDMCRTCGGPFAAFGAHCWEWVVFVDVVVKKQFVSIH